VAFLISAAHPQKAQDLPLGCTKFESCNDFIKVGKNGYSYDDHEGLANASNQSIL